MQLNLKIANQLDDTRRRLSEAQSLSEVKNLRDLAAAAKKFAKDANLGLQFQNEAAEIKLAAERKAGEMLAALHLRGGDRKSRKRIDAIQLADLGIDYNQSFRWQLEASASDVEFEEYITEIRKKGAELTTQGFLRYIKKLRHDGHVGGYRTKFHGTQSATFENKKKLDKSSNSERFIGISIENPSNLKSALQVVSQDLADHIEHLFLIVTPIYESPQSSTQVKDIERKTVVRLGHDIRQLLRDLKTAILNCGE